MVTHSVEERAERHMLKKELRRTDGTGSLQGGVGRAHTELAWKKES